MIIFDHMKLVNRQPREMKRFRKYLLERQAELEEIAIGHEADFSCCKREPYAITLQTITEVLKTKLAIVVEVFHFPVAVVEPGPSEGNN
jgi:hypothetical protein